MDKVAVMIEWILVFWLEHPANYADHSAHSSERQCRDLEQQWQRRFDLVKSRLRAECRERMIDNHRTPSTATDTTGPGRTSSGAVSK